MTADSIARLKITLHDVEPPVMRRIEVPLTIRLDRLHLALPKHERYMKVAGGRER
jgi:hypothetical protein